ncbi:MAG: MgtC/SapB family protein [Cyanobacteria bacterium]|nr:MgtC/SapB family protein [Cyanobacteriota bacterium]
MDWQLELVMACRAVLAAFLGGVVGLERERHGQDAGIRTYAAVSLGACVFGLVSMHALGSAGIDTRIAAQVVSGVGFLGAGVIMREQGRTTGLTTAATVWATASVGLALAFGMYLLGILCTAIISILLASHHLPGWKMFSAKSKHADGNSESHHSDD